MANMKYSKRLLKQVQNAYKKQDSDPSGPRQTSNDYQRVDSGPDGHLGAVSLDTNMSRIVKLGPVRVNLRPQMTIDDDGRWMIPFEPASPPSFVDTPDSIPLLNSHPVKPDPAAMRATNHGRVQNQSPTQTQLSQPAPFRVIIVGGSPTGLVLAHALHQAGIEFTLLERSPTIPTTPDRETDNNNSGTTSLLLWPNSARILDQLGLLRQTCKLSCPVRTRQTYLADGAPLLGEDHDVFARARHDHGRPCILIDRAALLRLLWESLPGREARERTGREVVSVETHDTGVRVVCGDGSFEEGSVIVGCDGVHGVVRRAVCEGRAEKKTMRRFGLASLGGSGSGSGKADRTVEARYYGLVGSAPLLDGLEASVCYETRGDDRGTTFQVFAGEDTAHFLVYIPLHRPTHKRTEYPAQNADYLASALVGHAITDKIKFGDLWRSRWSGKMVDFHEGVAEKWYHERIVLAGDVAHSMTPVLGLGVNTGWQGVVELTNGLRRLLLLHHHVPSTCSHGAETASIKKMFKAYQHSREDHARTVALISSFYARAIAHQGRLSRFCNWAAPGVTGDVALLDRQAAWAVRQGVTLDFVEERHFKEGRLKWANPRRRIDTAEGRKGETVWVYPGIPIRVGAN